MDSGNSIVKSFLGRKRASPSDDDDDELVHDQMPPWISDLANLGWRDNDFDWKDGIIDNSQIGQVLKIERCPFV